MVKKSLYRKIGCMILSMSLATSIFSFTSSAQEVTDKWMLREVFNGQIEAELTSAIDGSSFISSYDPETGIVSAYTMDGKKIGQRNNYDEEAFQELVETNRNVTKEISEAPSAPGITPRFNVEEGSVYVPRNTNPSRGTMIVSNFLTPPNSHSRIGVETFSFPSGMDSINIYFINVYGDDYSYWYDVDEYDTVYHNMRYAGDGFGARVSSDQGSFSNVTLRIFSR